MQPVPDIIDETSVKDLLMQLPERIRHVIMRFDKVSLNDNVYTRECVQRVVDGLQGKTLLVTRCRHGLANNARPEDIVGIASEFMMDAKGCLVADVKLTHHDWAALVSNGVKMSFTACGSGSVNLTTGEVTDYTLDSVVPVVKP